jgi:CheY-like chemotaxis protein
MPEGGHITIATGTRVLDESFKPGHPESASGAFATLTVRDSGIGMDESTKAQIFEPFFTTKAVGEGTGLGLATTFGIVQQHGGLIEVESSPGAGTSVTVFLPLVDEALPEEVPSEILDAVGGDETILLAEDDPGVRLVVEAMLEEAGYRLIVAVDGCEAMDLLDRHGSEIDLAILDVIMPGAGGLEVIEHLRGSGSLLKVLLTSGYSPDLTHTTAVEQAPLLTKPFRRDELLHKVRTVLDS